VIKSRFFADSIASTGHGARLILGYSFPAPPGRRPSEPSAVVIVNPASWEVVATLTDLWGAPVHRVTSDRRTLVIVSPGYHSDNRREMRRSEIIRVNVQSGAQLSRSDISEHVAPWSGRPKTRRPIFALSPDGAMLFIGDPGVASTDPRKYVEARQLVVNVADGSLAASIPTGPNALVRWVPGIETRAFVLSAAASLADDRGRRGRLQVVRDGIVEASLPVEDAPWDVRASTDGRRALVVSRKGLTSINLTTLTVERTFRLENTTELVLGEDGRRAFAMTGLSEVSRLDLVEGTVGEPIKTGRASVRVGNVFGQVAAAAAAGAFAGVAGAVIAPYGYPYPLLPYVPVSPTYQAHVAISGEGDAYVLSTETRDLALVDGRTSKISAHIPVSGFRILPTPGRVLVQDLKSIRVVDVTAHRVSMAIQADSNFRDVQTAPGGGLVCAAWVSSLSCFTLRSGTVSAYPLKLENPSAIAFPLP
jgi:hypothetical protein